MTDPGPPPRKRRPQTLGGAVYLAVLAVSAVAILVVVLGDWRVGVRVMAAGLVAAGAARLLLPRGEAGMLAVRPRALDVTLLVLVGALLWWLAGSIPDQPSTV